MKPVTSLPRDAPANRADDVLEVGGRLAAGPSERLIEAAFRRELEDQLHLFDALHWTDIAHTQIMIDAGVVPPEAGRELLVALLQLGSRPSDFVPDAACGDLYTNREAWLAARTATVGWLGCGRARREAITTAFQIKLREDLLSLGEALTSTGLAFANRAAQSRQALMPDYTYLQTAQPTTFGHYLLGFAYPMLRDLDRLRALYDRVNRSSAGCGSSNGSRLPQDRHRLAQALGFKGLAVHGRDAMWQTDLPIETAAALTAILTNLDRLAEDLQIFTTDEFGLIELDDSHARASKIMPQKKNPYALTHVRGLANSMIGTLTAMAAMGRTPSGQPDNRLTVYGALPRAVADTGGAVALMGELVERLRFNDLTARNRLNQGFALATDLAESLLLDQGLDFRSAHRLVGNLVRAHLGVGSFAGLTTAEIEDTSERLFGRRISVAPAALRAAMDPVSAIAARAAPGGAAAASMSDMIAECEQGFRSSEDWLATCRQRLAKARHGLEQIVERTVNP